MTAAFKLHLTLAYLRLFNLKPSAGLAFAVACGLSVRGSRVTYNFHRPPISAAMTQDSSSFPQLRLDQEPFPQGLALPEICYSLGTQLNSICQKMQLAKALVTLNESMKCKPSQFNSKPPTSTRNSEPCTSNTLLKESYGAAARALLHTEVPSAHGRGVVPSSFGSTV